jgi:hypothetical protein
MEPLQQPIGYGKLPNYHINSQIQDLKLKLWAAIENLSIDPNNIVFIAIKAIIWVTGHSVNGGGQKCIIKDLCPFVPLSTGQPGFTVAGLTCTARAFVARLCRTSLSP